LQGIILVLHSFSLLVGFALLRIKLYRPFGAALVLDSLAGTAFYAGLLFFSLPNGHDWSQIRSLLQAIIWASFGIGILLNQRNHS
jgi:hypothetical protein